ARSEMTPASRSARPRTGPLAPRRSVRSRSKTAAPRAPTVRTVPLLGARRAGTTRCAPPRPAPARRSPPRPRPRVAERRLGCAPGRPHRPQGGPRGHGVRAVAGLDRPPDGGHQLDLRDGPERDRVARHLPRRVVAGQEGGPQVRRAPPVAPPQP